MDIDKITNALYTIKVICGALIYIWLGLLILYIAIPLVMYQTIPINYGICIGIAIIVIVISWLIKLIVNISYFICLKLNEIAYNTKYKKI